MSSPTLFGIRIPRGTGQRFFVENIYEELDAPGEWFFDAVNDQLFLYPRQGDATQDVVAVTLATLVSVRGAGASKPAVGISLINLTFTETRSTFLEQYEVPSGECARWGSRATLSLKRARNSPQRHAHATLTPRSRHSHATLTPRSRHAHAHATLTPRSRHSRVMKAGTGRSTAARRSSWSRRRDSWPRAASLIRSAGTA